MLLGLETFSYHLAFAYGKMDVFAFIKRVAELGLDGVQINVEGADLGHLGSGDPTFLRDVRAMADALGLYVELDTCDTDPQNVTRVLHVCHALGAEKMRIYSSIGGDVKEELKQAAEDLGQVIPLCAEYGVRIAYENHEYETSRDVLEVVRRVDSEYVGAHVDTGNSMMVWEDPIRAIEAMAPYAVSTHFKDHMVIMADNQPMIVGVPLGKGSIDCAEAFRILANHSPLARINIEVCYGYVAPFRVPEEEGFGAKLGEGAFRVHQPPYDPAVVAPNLLRALGDGLAMKSHAWQDLAKIPSTPAQREELLCLQDQAVVESVAYVKSLNH
ncbi:MAG: sugar phosphate isomerase/epimerase family protein [Candidatus Latescibacterota bacterium]